MKIVVTQTDTLARIIVQVQGIAPMPPATAAAPGAVIAGAGLAVAIDGTLSVPALMVEDGLAATGSTLADALALTEGINVVETVPAGSGCVLPASPASAAITVVNGSTEDLFVYPPAGAQIGAGAAGAPVIVGPNQRVLFFTKSATTKWTAA